MLSHIAVLRKLVIYSQLDTQVIHGDLPLPVCRYEVLAETRVKLCCSLTLSRIVVKNFASTFSPEYGTTFVATYRAIMSLLGGRGCQVCDSRSAGVPSMDLRGCGTPRRLVKYCIKPFFKSKVLFMLSSILFSTFIFRSISLLRHCSFLQCQRGERSRSATSGREWMCCGQAR